MRPKTTIHSPTLALMCAAMMGGAFCFSPLETTRESSEGDFEAEMKKMLGSQALANRKAKAKKKGASHARCL